MSFQKLQRRKDFLRFLEKLAPTHLKKIGTFDHGDVLLFQLCHHEFGFLDTQVCAHHGVSVGGMSQKVFSNLNCTVYSRYGNLVLSIVHISAVEQSCNPENGANILAGPVGDGLPFTSQKPFVFQEVVGHQVKGFLGEIQRLSVLADWQCHQVKYQIAIGGADFGRNGWSSECPPANSGRRRRIQESCNQPPACHGAVGHDLIQHTGLDGENSGKGRVHDAL